jgi:hypothetical protein
MAIDYVIDLNCIPKEELTTDGIIERLKEEERANTIIALFRQNGDQRPPSEMGFEFTRSTPEGEEERRVIVVQDLLDRAAELQPLAHHCAGCGCPANRAGRPFGCIGFIQYPVTSESETWMLDRLPVPDEPLVWLLLKQGSRNFVMMVNWSNRCGRWIKSTSKISRYRRGYSVNLASTPTSFSKCCLLSATSTRITRRCCCSF